MGVRVRDVAATAIRRHASRSRAARKRRSRTCGLAADAFPVPMSRGRATMDGAMKRLGMWAFYAIGAVAVGYLALYLYAVLTTPEVTPGEPIKIFRKQDAPEYS